MLKWRTEALTTSRDPIFLPELLGAIDECPSPQPDKTRLPSPSFPAVRAPSTQRWPQQRDRQG